MADSEERAVLNGLEKKLLKLMSKGATRAQWAEWLRAPLEHALVEGDKKLAMMLLKAGADGGAGWEGCDGRTLLGAAAEGGNHELVSALLEAGGLAELDDVSGDEGRTALHHAVAGGHTDAARVLMLAGADVELLDDRDRSALHYAVEGGHLQLAGNAIIGGADLDVEDGEGNTPLHLAAAHDDKAFINTLLRREASVSATNKAGQQPLHVAVKHGHIAVAEALLKAGADPNVRSNDNIKETPLFLACRNLAMTRTLIEHGADVKVVDLVGFTPLHKAGTVGDTDIIDALVEAGADIEASSCCFSHPDWGDYQEVAPLHLAALLCSLPKLLALLRNGADVNATYGEGHTPLHLVCDARAKMSAELAGLFEHKVVDVADLLLRWGADETLTDNNGRTPEQLIEDVAATRPLREVLANAPADRAWRRRGMLVMCRAFPDKMRTKGGEGRAGKAKARRGRGRGGASARGGHGMGNVLTRAVELDDDAIFRTIVGYL